MKKFFGALLVALAFVGVAKPVVSAPIVDYTDIGGLRTFLDQGTGLIWVDMDNFFDMSTAQMKAVVEAVGFTFADRATLETLLNSLPLPDSATWDSYAAIMGSAPNRELIWGSYDDGGDPNFAGWAFSFREDSSWSFVDSVVGINDIPNSPGPFTDMNIWAYQPIPEPSSLALGLIGAAAVGGYLRRRSGR